jgi:hypothetical protein
VSSPKNLARRERTPLLAGSYQGAGQNPTRLASLATLPASGEEWSERQLFAVKDECSVFLAQRRFAASRSANRLTIVFAPIATTNTTISSEYMRGMSNVA